MSSSKPSELRGRYSHIQVEAAEEEILLNDFDSMMDDLGVRILKPPQLDGMMAVKLHKALPISRRQAADPNMWAWLGVLYAPDLVALRWPPKDEDSLRTANRFMGDRVRQTYARLWWAAELSRVLTDYTLTEKLLSLSMFQQVNEDLFGRAFSQSRQTLEQFVRHIDGLKESQIRKFAVELTVVFSTRPPECMSDQELSSLFSKVKDSIVRKQEIEATG